MAFPLLRASHTSHASRARHCVMQIGHGHSCQGFKQPGSCTDGCLQLVLAQDAQSRILQHAVWLQRLVLQLRS